MNNNKILVTVFVPMLETEYDVFIPINKKIRNVTRLQNEAVVDLSNGCFPLKDDIMLYNRNDGTILEPCCGDGAMVKAIKKV